MRKKIVIAEPGYYSGKAVQILESVGDVSMFRGTEKKDFEKVAENCDVLIVRLAHKVTKEIIEKNSNLLIVGTSTTGLDHIDLEAASKKNVSVISLKGELDFLKQIHATPEHAITILLAALRKIFVAQKDIFDGEWRQEKFIGVELHGKKVGIIGFGRVGSMVAHILRAFGCIVCAYDPFVSKDQMEAQNVEYVSLQQLLSDSDIISLHIPYSEENRNYLSEKDFSCMKDGVIFVNTSRGQLVDEVALLKALESGKISLAALDVLNNEGRDGFLPNRLIEYAKKHDNLLITPHIAGTTKESMEKTQMFIAKKIVDKLNLL